MSVVGWSRGGIVSRMGGLSRMMVPFEKTRDFRSESRRVSVGRLSYRGACGCCFLEFWGLSVGVWVTLLHLGAIRCMEFELPIPGTMITNLQLA